MKKIQILGPGCARCEKLFENVELAVRELALECEVEKVTAIDEIIRFGVLSTPALAVDGIVKVAGKVPSPGEIKALLE